MSAEEDLINALYKAIGENDENQEVTQWINTGFEELNRYLSGSHDGGLGFGRLYEMYGPSSSGKTALATRIMIEAQKMGGVVMFVDYEKSFDVGMAESMGLNTSKGKWIYKRPRTWEQGNDDAAKAAMIIRKSGAISTKSPILIVFDSIASAVPQSTFGKDMSDLNMNDTTALSRVTSTTLKSMALVFDESQATGLYLNQIRTKPGVMFGDPTTTPGGGAMEFYASGRVALTRTKRVKKVTGSEDIMIGQSIRAKVVKSKHTRPFRVADLEMNFRDDDSAYFDDGTILANYLIKLGLMEKSSDKRYLWEDKKYTAAAFTKMVESNPEVLEKMRALLPKGDEESSE